MELILKKFTEHFTEIYGDQKENFLEENGRRFFLLPKAHYKRSRELLYQSTNQKPKMY